MRPLRPRILEIQISTSQCMRPVQINANARQGTQRKVTVLYLSKLLTLLIRKDSSHAESDFKGLTPKCHALAKRHRNTP